MALGVAWMLLLGSLLVYAHVWVWEELPWVGNDRRVPAEPLRRWMLAGGGVATLVWFLGALGVYARSHRLIPFLVGARPATGVEKEYLEDLLADVGLAAGVGSGLPALYVLESPAANAFACGRSLTKGSITVTRGLIQALDRRETAAVLGHELAHLKNGDSLFVGEALAFAWVVVGSAVVGTAVFSLLLLLGFGALKASLEVVKGEELENQLVGCLLGAALGLFALVAAVTYAVAVGAVVLLVAVGVKIASSSVSHAREFLADACSAQWTRDPLALVSALVKVSSGHGVASGAAWLVAPLWLAPLPLAQLSGVGQTLVAFLMSTHPPGERRVNLLVAMAGGVAVVEAPELAAQRGSRWAAWRECFLPALATVLALGAAAWLFSSVGARG
ncbi:MAG: M48 family metalloprotease [Thermoanaerobaculum sp.]